MDAVEQMKGRHWRLLVGGELVPARSGREFAVRSPIDESLIASVPDADEDDVNAAATAALAALPAWRDLGAPSRSAVVLRLADAVAVHAEELAVLDVLDVGAPITEMRRDVDRAVAALRYFAGLAREIKGDTIPASGQHLHLTTREPYGVVARIVPFNHPAMFAASKIAAPLVAGNCVLLKPAEGSPLSALRLGELFADLLPKGVLSIVVGDGPAVPRTIVRHPAVSRIGFIGSEATGRSIQRDAAETGVKNVTLELGGKNALIACPDADLDEVAAGVVRGMNFTWAGQSCGSTSRLLAHASVVDDLTSRVITLLRGLRMGSPLDPISQLGPLASAAQYKKTLRYIEIAQAEGARLLAGGARPADVERGFFVSPTVLGSVTPQMRIAQEEVFGPVLSILTWQEESEAIAIANGVKYGLTASVWTNDLGRATRIVRALEAGFVWVNGSSQHFLGVPFGGVKSSGLGREESLEELLSYTCLKSVNVMQNSVRER